MTLYFSATTNGFYSSVIHGAKIPPDAVEITEAQHRQMMDAQASGKQITSDSKGRPKAIDRVITEEAKWRLYQAQARIFLDKSDQVVWRCFEVKIDVPVEWVQYRDALRVILRAATGDSSNPLPVAPPKPEY